MSKVDPQLRDLFKQLVNGQAKWPLYLYGPAGAGKSCAALCLADVCPTACLRTVEELCNEIMGIGHSPAALWQSVGGKHMGVLDELGVREKVGDLHYSAVKNFADARASHANGVGVYISNLSPRELMDAYDDRIVSRILCGTKHYLQSRDRRVTG
jgi:hypothetical protein